LLETEAMMDRVLRRFGIERLDRVAALPLRARPRSRPAERELVGAAS